MSINRGTLDGEAQEIIWVKKYNKRTHSYIFDDYIKSIRKNYIESNIYMVHITENHYSTLSERKVMTRADIHSIYSDDPNIIKLLNANDHYLSDVSLRENNIKFENIDKSGISIKIIDSKSYQILKLTPNSFFSMFGNYELGAGISLYVNKDNELPKNKNLLTGWQTSVETMIDYFTEITLRDKSFYLDKDKCSKIKRYSIDTLTKLIENDTSLKEKIFNGIGLYDEPYTAHYLLHNDIVRKLDYIPFSITTGSGRSRGDYTVVLKPK